MQRRLAGFTLREMVGFGASGEVWRAQPDDGGAAVALRWLTAETVDTELLAGSGLRHFEHPHVARLLDVRRDGPSVVLVEEFVAGKSLAVLLAERVRLSSAEVVTLLTPVADALGAAHDAGLLHGNVRPTAVLVTPDGRPILTELGLRQSLGAPTDGGAGQEYLDPAVARGGSPTSDSDVFGVAAIGYHALGGRPPWPGAHAAATSQLARGDQGVDLTPLRTELPTRLVEVIARGLAVDPERRGTAKNFAADVRDSLEPKPLALAGPFSWSDLPPLEEGDSARMDIAGEVRRGGPGRHAATQHPQRDRMGGGQGLGCADPSAGWIARGGVRLVPRKAALGALGTLIILGVVVFGLGWNSSKTVPAQAGGPLGVASNQEVEPESELEVDNPGAEIDERSVPDSAQAWVALLSLLYDRRAAAFGTGELRLLEQVFTADSPQLIADSSELTQLVAAGQLLRGFAPRVLELREVLVDAEHATLAIIDEFAAYETVPATDARAAPLAAHPGRGPAAVEMSLRLTEDGWRIHTAQRQG